jgi:SAM-dependent methyltransferase
MPDRSPALDADSVRAAWDHAADAYTDGQASGRDWYRYEFLGPAQVALCGDVRGLRVLDVGCGSGYMAREMAGRGARVSGIDISPRMIGHARRIEAEAPLGIEYHALDAAEVAARFDAASFDLAVSCIALQDMPDPAAVLRGVASVVRPGGRFVASITHPCTDTPLRQWERDDHGGKRWLCIDRYYERGPIDYTWLRWAYEFTTPALHVPLEDWFDWIVAAGFSVRAVREPRATDEAIRANPHLADTARVPYYVIFDLLRGG